MLFPQLSKSSFGHINLEREAAESKRYRKVDGRNPLLAPDKCQEMIDEFHHRHDLIWSFGGWLENRQRLLSGSYLDEGRTYLHLGVDYNVPQGTEVAMPWRGNIVRVDHDSDRDGGWGGRVIVEPLSGYFGQGKLPSSLDNYFIFAHLSDQIGVKVGDSLDKGKIIGSVGAPEVNGGWFSHLHVQAVTRAELERALLTDLADLDGYGRTAKKKEMSLKFPDPTSFIPFG